MGQCEDATRAPRQGLKMDEGIPRPVCPCAFLSIRGTRVLQPQVCPNLSHLRGQRLNSTIQAVTPLRRESLTSQSSLPAKLNPSLFPMVFFDFSQSGAVWGWQQMLSRAQTHWAPASRVKSHRNGRGFGRVPEPLSAAPMANEHGRRDSPWPIVGQALRPRHAEPGSPRKAAVITWQHASHWRGFPSMFVLALWKRACLSDGPAIRQAGECWSSPCLATPS